MTNRVAAEKFIVDSVLDISQEPQNVIIYKNLFKSMSDKEFDVFVERKMIPIMAPNFSKNKITVKRNLAIAKKLGVKFFQRLWVGANNGSPEFLTPIEYLCFHLPLRRCSQMHLKKLAIAENNKSLDSLTGQLSSSTKGSKITLPELHVLSAQGMDKSITELMKYRGGDSKGFLAMNAYIARYGQCNQDSIKGYSSGVEATKLVSTILTCMHLKNNLAS